MMDGLKGKDFFHISLAYKRLLKSRLDLFQRSLDRQIAGKNEK